MQYTDNLQAKHSYAEGNKIIQWEVNKMCFFIVNRTKKVAIHCVKKLKLMNMEKNDPMI